MVSSSSSASLTVVITGVSTGIGRASLQRLLQEGCHVFGSVRKQADAERISAEVAALPGQFTPLIFDVTDAEAVQAAAREVGAALSGATLSALINNAGMNCGPDPLELIPLNKLRYQVEVNLLAPVTVTQAFLPLLGTDRSRVGAPGRVVFVGSVYGSYGLPWQAGYCATKHALEGLSESLRLELRVFGIDVVMIRPGPVDSEIWNKSMKSEWPLEGGAKSGDWIRYADSSYGAAMASTREFVLSELEAKDFSLPCEAIAGTIYQAVASKNPALKMVKTSRYMEAWALPRWVPTRLRDRVIATKLGIKRLHPSDTEDQPEGTKKAD